MTEAPHAGIDEGIRDTLYQLSQRHYSHGLYEACASVLAFLLRHDALSPGLHYALGKALHAQSQHGGAVQSYQRALKLGLADIDVHLYLGQCLIHLDRFAQAGAALQYYVGLAEAQAASAALRHKVDRARHLLEQVIVPRLGVLPGAAAASARVAEAATAAAAAAPAAPQPLETTR